MIDIKVKSECCGCYACTNVCPKQCIDMNIDNEGFWYPNVNKDLCIDCSLCEKVCPVIQDAKEKDFDTIAYACKNKTESVRLTSSSGGVFTNLCEYIIQNNGVVFGTGFNENFEVEHSKAITISECENFRGSKYVQSKIGNTCSEVKIDYAVSCNPCIFRPVKYNEKREKFFEDFNEDNLNDLIDECTRIPIIKKVVRKIRSIL